MPSALSKGGIKIHTVPVKIREFSQVNDKVGMYDTAMLKTMPAQSFGMLKVYK